MVATVGSIRTVLEADLTGYSAGLKAGERATAGFQKRVGGTMNALDKSIARLRTSALDMGKAIAIGFIGAGVSEFVDKTREAARNVADLAAEAKRAGVSFEAFQELSYAASKSRVSVDALTDGLKELQLRADEFIRTGKGSGAESFQRLGYDAETLAAKLQEPDKLFEEIIGKIGKLNTAARIRVADEIFGGTGGEQFVQLLDRGVAGIRQARQEARDLDLVLSNDLAVTATRVNDRFNDLSGTLETNVTRALVNVGDVAFRLADGPLGDLADKLQTLDDKARSLFGFLSHFTLNDDIYRLLAGGGGGAGGASFGATERRLKLLRDQRKNLSELGFDTADVDSQIRSAEAELSRRNNRSGPNALSGPEITLPGITVTGTGGGSGSGSAASSVAAAVDAYERLSARMAETTARMNAVTAAQSRVNPAINDFGRAAAFAGAKQDLLNAALKSGKENTPALRAEIDALAKKYADAVVQSNMLAEAQNDALDALAFRKDLVAGALHDITDALADGKLSWEEFGDIALNVLERVTDRQHDDLETLIGKDL